jgi:hypothetical protein
VTAELDKGLLPRLDRALELVRKQPARELVRALWPGAALSLLALAVYYAERVEGVRSLRSLFALGFALLFVARAVSLGRWAGGASISCSSPTACPPCTAAGRASRARRRGWPSICGSGCG